MRPYAENDGADGNVYDDESGDGNGIFDAGIDDMDIYDDAVDVSAARFVIAQQKVIIITYIHILYNIYTYNYI